MRKWLIVIFCTSLCRAQMRTDGSLGARTTIAGPALSIPASLGQQRGGNLFHSFATFNINTGESATFTGPLSVKNILTRVTGATPSLIAGPLRCDIPSANLYLINPTGIIFGPGGAIDVHGSFVATTADTVRLGKSSQFSSVPHRGDVLTSAPPAAFGFLGSRGGIAALGTNLKVRDGHNISLLSSGRATLFSAGLIAPAGRINIVAGSGAGQVTVDPSDANSTPLATFARYANANFTGGSAINTSGARGGPITLLARSATIVSTQIVSGTSGSQPGCPIDLRLTHAISLGDGASVSSVNSSTGRGSDLSIRAGSIVIDGGGNDNTAIRTVALIGPGGNINVAAKSVMLKNSGNISVTSVARGAAGRIDIASTSLTLDTGGFITGGVVAATRGADVAITTRSLRMDSQAQIGLVTVTALAGGTLRLDGGEIHMSGGSKIIGLATSGPASTLSLSADSLTLDRGAFPAHPALSMGEIYPSTPGQSAWMAAVHPSPAVRPKRPVDREAPRASAHSPSLLPIAATSPWAHLAQATAAVSLSMRRTCSCAAMARLARAAFSPGQPRPAPETVATSRSSPIACTCFAQQLSMWKRQALAAEERWI